jgi:uncharacterized protein YbjT (DUF2867 family)
MRCLVTGATGYVGGRLVPELLAKGHQVRVMARHPERLADRAWINEVEVVGGDATNAASLRTAMADMHAAFYLLHSLQSGHGFEAIEHQTATGFAAAAKAAGVRRIVYLGALIPPVPTQELTKHLRSRAEVGRILRASGVPTAELRAAVIIGSGSASFEIVRYLTERLPFMITPRWVRVPTQPIAIRDVLRYLVGCVDLPAEVNRSFDIGGPEVMTYAGMMRGYASAAGLPPRVIVPISVLTPGLSSHWVGLVTPVPRAIARPLVDSLKLETTCREHDIATYVPDPPEGLIPFERAVKLALARIQGADIATTWSDSSLPGAPSEPLPTDPGWAGGSLYTDERETVVRATPEALWHVIDGVGGGHGYYSFPLAWAIRGWLDRIGGGVGLQRGRRDPDELRVGDPLDFWRVEARVPLSLLRLRAEMRMPGLAWLELAIRLDADLDGHEQTVYTQRALFHPRGLKGHIYWKCVAPFHGIIFGSMLKNIRTRAEHPDQRPKGQPAKSRAKSTTP